MFQDFPQFKAQFFHNRRRSIGIRIHGDSQIKSFGSPGRTNVASTPCAKPHNRKINHGFLETAQKGCFVEQIILKCFPVGNSL